MDGRFVGRTQISTKSYMSPTVTETRLYQELSGKRLSRVLQCAPGSSCQRTLTLTAYAKLEAMHVLPGSRWTISLAVETESEDKNGQAAVFTDERSFDFGTRDWQSASVRVCLAPSTVVKRVRVQGSLDGFRGSALWDQWVLRLD